MIAHLRLLDRAKGAEPDMQHDRHDRRAPRADLVKQFLGEMQPCRRRGSAARLAGIYRLIETVIFKFFGDIGRERHAADLLEHTVDRRAADRKGHDAVAFLNDVRDLAFKQAVAEDEPLADLRLFAGADQRLPGAVPVPTQEQELHHAVRLLRIRTVEPRGNDLGIVDDQHILGADIVEYVIEMLMRDCTARAVDDHQARRVARFGGVLRDLLLRQVVIKILFPQFGRNAFILYHVVSFAKNAFFHTLRIDAFIINHSSQKFK